jgi:hypothetical protein
MALKRGSGENQPFRNSRPGSREPEKGNFSRVMRAGRHSRIFGLRLLSRKNMVK